MWILFLIIAVLILILEWSKKKRDATRFMQLAKKLPGPTPLPIIGNALEYGTNTDEFLKNMLRIVDEYGEVTANWIGPVLYVITHKAEDLEILLSNKSNLDKAEIYKYLKSWLGHGLISSPGEKWKTRRKILTPSFHFKILENYVEVFGSNLKILVDKMETENGKEEFNVQPFIERSTMDIICETAMATQIREEENESEFRNSMKNACQTVLYRAFKPWLKSQFMFDLSSTGRLYNKSVDVVNDFTSKIIKRKKKELDLRPEMRNGKKDLTTDLLFGYKQKICFIDLLLNLASDPNNNLTDEDILEEVNTFMFAGHDTTSSAISFTLYLLSRHPKIQEEVISEIQDVFGDLSEKPFTYKDLADLKLMERVIKETLRLYPSVPYIGRVLNEEVKLHNGEILPNGCSVVMLFYKLHRDPKVFPNPEEFNPDNFLPERMVGRHPFAYCPFSAGPRNCIGQKFAMLEIKATVMCVLRRYRLLPGKLEIIPKSELVLRSSTGIQISITKREKDTLETDNI